MEKLLNKNDPEKKTVTDAIGIIARNVISSIGEETVAEETVAEETVVDETVIDETVADETVADETVVDETVVEPELEPAPEPEIVYVSGGSFSNPYYEFYSDKNGHTKITDLKLDITKSYKFERINNVSLQHPFYISDTGRDNNFSSAITIIGDGNYTTGITGSESITLTFNTFSITDTLTYYCTTHIGMVSTFSIYEPEPALIVEATNKEVSTKNIQDDIEIAITDVLNNYETLRTGGPLYNTILYFKVPTLVES